MVFLFSTRVAVCCTVALFYSALGSNAQAPTSTDQIVSTARAHLTPGGTQWALAEGQRLRRGEINAAQVEKDAASVMGGTTQGGVRDELVLIALLNAQGSRGPSVNTQALPAARKVDTLQSKIQDIVQTLNDTQSQSRKTQ